jgi:Holliday junction resolvasome RuvABC endonuclease subunit
MRVMGVDLGIAKVACSIWENEELVETQAVDMSGITERTRQLSQLSRYIRREVDYHDVELVVIEDILIGNNRKYSIKLAQTMGAVLAGLEHLDVIPVNVGKWKKEVIGDGHASKEAVRNYLLERDSAYADLCGSDQDRFDAACIGYYGVILSDRAERLAESR